MGREHEKRERESTDESPKQNEREAYRQKTEHLSKMDERERDGEM